MSSTPYISTSLPGTGGSIKVHQDDFQVEEIPLYPFAGVGEHAYLLIEKRGISTYTAISILAKAIGRRSVDFGYAGLKDAQAVTRQWISIEHEPNSRFEKLELPTIRIVEQTRHRNKLKLGHLAGNRFTVRIRHEDWDKSPSMLTAAYHRASAILHALGESGVPNFFGQQRFGMRLDNHRLGMALLKRDAKKFMELWLGSADESVDRGGCAPGTPTLRRRQYPGRLLRLARPPACGTRRSGRFAEKSRSARQSPPWGGHPIAALAHQFAPGPSFQ